MIESDRVLRVGDDLVEAVDFIRHVRVNAGFGAELAGQLSRLKSLLAFQQTQQVNDLMVAPIADVAPRILGVADLPVNAVARDPVGVVTVCRRSIKEYMNHLSEPGGIALREALPILENVTPVALIGVKRTALFVLDVDVESIPGTARVAVATAEAQRQILMRQP